MVFVRKIFFLILFFNLSFNCVFAQTEDLSYSLDVNSNTIALPKIFSSNIDLSGKGISADKSSSQNLASKKSLESWNKEISNTQIYRLQFNLWDSEQLSKDKQQQAAFIDNYANLIKSLNDKGAIVLLDFFGTPQGMGKVLDKKSVPADYTQYKQLVKNYIREFSCNRKLKIWYEVWTAPDLEEFFLGTTQDYLLLYKNVAEAVSELKLETKADILIGGPSVSWWFRTLEDNSIVTPESSLIYELIKFCYQHKLPLDFISWHAYSTDPKVEKENTKYNRKPAELIKPWLSYFNFDENIPLIIDEWNYDNGLNLSQERDEKSFVNASYIPSRLKYMSEAGIDYQVFFSLQDFQDNAELVNRNVGVFSSKNTPKNLLSVFKMISMLGQNMFLSSTKLTDDFVGVVATKQDSEICILIYNYIDTQAAKNFISKNVAFLNEKEREVVVDIVRTDKWEKILNKTLDLSGLSLTGKLLNMFNKAIEINDKSKKFIGSNRSFQFELKNMKEDYSYQRYVVDSSCLSNCNFVPFEEKELELKDSYQWPINLTPYSVNLLVFKPLIKKDKAQSSLSVSLIKEVSSIAEQKEIQKTKEEKLVVEPEVKKAITAEKENVKAVEEIKIKDNNNVTQEQK